MSKARELAELGQEVTVGTDGSIVFNEDGADQDFRVETSANASSLFINGLNGSVVVGSTSNRANPDGSSAGLTVANGTHLSTNQGQYPLTLSRLGGVNESMSMWVTDSATYFSNTQDETAGGNFVFQRTNATRTDASYLSMSDTAGVTINEGGLDTDFRVESDANDHMLYVDAGNNRIGLGTYVTDTGTNVANGICTNSAIGTYSDYVPNVSAGATGTIDIPFSRLTRGIYEVSFWAYSNGGYYVHGFVQHMYVMTNPEYAQTGGTISERYCNVTYAGANGTNMRIQWTNTHPSWASYGGRYICRRIG
jgi:hypothetical protein